MSTIKINGGRGRFSDAGPRITIFKYAGSYSHPQFVIEHGGLNYRDGGTFSIESLHEDGTDFEHDAAKIALFEGAGLMFSDTVDSRVSFTGVILRAYYYPPDFALEPGAGTSFSSDDPVIRVCDSERYHPERDADKRGHLLMPFIPPAQMFEPRQVTIELDFNPPEDK